MSIVIRLFVWDAEGRGRRIISRSKRRTIMDTVKNFMKKRRHADPIVSNPHL